MRPAGRKLPTSTLKKYTLQALPLNHNKLTPLTVQGGGGSKTNRPNTGISKFEWEWLDGKNTPEALNMEAVSSCETLLSTCKTTRRYSPKENTLQLLLNKRDMSASQEIRNSSKTCLFAQ
jgi:hypothetical protein